MFFFIMVSSFHLFGVVVLHVWCIPASQVETSVWAKVCVCGWHGTVQYEVSKIKTFWQLFHLNNCTLRASKPLRASCKEGIAGFGGAWLQTGMSKTRKPCPLRKCQIINKRAFMRIKKSARCWKLALAAAAANTESHAPHTALRLPYNVHQARLNIVFNLASRFK